MFMYLLRNKTLELVLIHLQTSTVEPLKLGNVKVMSSHTLLDMLLLNQAGI